MFNRFSVSHSPLSYDMTPAQSDGPFSSCPNTSASLCLKQHHFWSWFSAILQLQSILSFPEVLVWGPESYHSKIPPAQQCYQIWYATRLIICYNMIQYVTRIYSAIQSIHFCSSFWPYRRIAPASSAASQADSQFRPGVDCQRPRQS